MPANAETKNLLLRLEPELAAQLRAVAEVEGQSISDVVRQAIADHVSRRRRDPSFRKLLRRHAERHQRLLDDLAGDGDR